MEELKLKRISEEKRRMSHETEVPLASKLSTPAQPTWHHALPPKSKRLYTFERKNGAFDCEKS